MKLPDKIIKLLRSGLIEDRAIAISLIEKDPNYLDYFDSRDTTTNTMRSCYYFINDPSVYASSLSMIVRTQANIFWINDSYIYVWMKDKPSCPWFVDNEITI